VTASNNCKATKTVRVTVQPPPVFAVTPATQTICLGETMTVTASGGDSYNWTPAPGITDPAANKISFKPTASGSYSVAINHAACNRSQTLSATVQVNPLPAVTISKSNDIDCSAIQAQLTATGGTSYVWTPAVSLNATNIPNPVTTTLVTTNYKVKVTSANGCFKEDSVTVYFNGGTQSNLMIPNAFTPNKDLVNDVFKVSFGGAKKFEMLVYNRWGELVFRSTDPSKGWDGNYRSKPQPQGVYIYLVTGEGICGGKVQRKGTVMLMR
jgi:gliding motility-associated-like protein